MSTRSMQPLAAFRMRWPHRTDMIEIVTLLETLLLGVDLADTGRSPKAGYTAILKLLSLDVASLQLPRRSPAAEGRGLFVRLYLVGFRLPGRIGTASSPLIPKRPEAVRVGRSSL